MSRPQYGNDMDRPSPGDIIRRARERAESGAVRRESYNTFIRQRGLDDARNQYNNTFQEQQQQQPQPQSQYPIEDEPEATPSIPPRLRPVAGTPTGGQARVPRPQAPPGFQDEDGQLTLPISRPAPVPQWPLAGPVISSSGSSDSEPYRPPAGTQPPQRPPRPSKVPSMLDPSQIQGPTPVFQQQYQYQPQSNRNSENAASVPETPSTMSRPSTLSSVGSIPDFPLPVQLPIPPPPPPPPMPPRRSVNLGPPPSARRGASSFYSHLSYVSPIPEESPRSRSHASFASSAAMPESWGTPSNAQSPRYQEAFFDDRIDEQSQTEDGDSMYEDQSIYEGHSLYEEERGGDEDESQLVRSASIGRRGKAALVTTQSREFNSAEFGGEGQKPSPMPLQPTPFEEGTAYLETSSMSASTVPSSSKTGATAGTRAGAGAKTALTADVILSAYDAASATDPRASRRMSVSPQPSLPQGPRPFNRFSAIRRPPRLDIDAVRDAEARGSLTSLPDLIRRATRLAASLDRGRRPASRFDDLNDLNNYPPEKFVYDGNRKNVDHDSDEFNEKHQSGLSDMLAAFPPPAQAQSRNGFRQSIQSLRDNVVSWPLPPLNRANNTSQPRSHMSADMRNNEPPAKKGRRCCGLPLWGFIMLLIIIIILIAAAVIIPLEFFVLRNKSVTNTSEAAMQQCRNQVTCQNGGANVVTNGFCSCICVNGFTGFDCSVSDLAGCTTANIQGVSNITNVTLGDAIPRLLTDASTNFSISLSGTQILSKLNAGNLSCSAQNSLVTFDGQNQRGGSATDVVTDTSTSTTSDSTTDSAAVVNAAGVEGMAVATVTVMAGEAGTTTITLDPGVATTISISLGAGTSSSVPPFTTTTVTRTVTTSYTTSPSMSALTSTATTTPSSTSTAPAATGTGSAFTVTQEVLDFARIGVLYVLQKESLANAVTAQDVLQKFFSAARSATSGTTSTITSASNVTLDNGNTIDLVNFRVDDGTGVVGKKTTTSRLLLREMPEEPHLDLWDWP